MTALGARHSATEEYSLWKGQKLPMRPASSLSDNTTLPHRYQRRVRGAGRRAVCGAGAGPGNDRGVRDGGGGAAQAPLRLRRRQAGRHPRPVPRPQAARAAVSRSVCCVCCQVLARRSAIKGQTTPVGKDRPRKDTGCAVAAALHLSDVWLIGRASRHRTSLL